MRFKNARFANADSSTVSVDINGVSSGVRVGNDNPVWREVMAEVERTKGDAEPFVIAPYVEPVIDPKVARANALAGIGWILEQIKGYEVIGEDATISIDKYKAARAKIDAEYPPQ